MIDISDDGITTIDPDMKKNEKLIYFYRYCHLMITHTTINPKDTDNAC